MDPLFECKICQERTNHKTSNCPNLVCKTCNKRGHASKYCPENRPEKIIEKEMASKRSSSSNDQEPRSSDEPISKEEKEKILREIKLEKRSGKVFRFSKTTSRGLIEIESGKYNTVCKLREFSLTLF